MTVTDYPPTYRPLAERHGPPAMVEEARASWGRIVKGAETGGTITLIARNGPAGPDWAAVVPLTEVPDPGRCPVWSLSGARARLGEVVDAAVRCPRAQILTFFPGQSGACNADGDVTDEPIEPAFVATARDWEGKPAGVGGGTTMAEALIRVYRRPAAFLGSGAGDPWAGPFTDEPPF